MAPVVIAALALGTGTGDAADVPVSGRTTLIKVAKLAKFLAKAAITPPVASPAEDATVGGAELTLFDTLGNSAGSKGYVCNGKQDFADEDPKGTCPAVLEFLSR